ncbi:hypothetical protein AAGG49_22720, partial [Stenotrophomonas maltophilia]
LNPNRISVEYMALPPNGHGSKYKTHIKTVWCAAEPRQAQTNPNPGGNQQQKNVTGARLGASTSAEQNYTEAVT